MPAWPANGPHRLDSDLLKHFLPRMGAGAAGEECPVPRWNWCPCAEVQPADLTKGWLWCLMGSANEGLPDQSKSSLLLGGAA